MNELATFLQEAWARPEVRALVIVVASVVAGKLVDVLICRIVLRLTVKTNTDLDDRLIQLMHRPIFFTVMLVGLYIAVRTVSLPAGVERTLIALIQTLAVLIWSFALLKIVSTLLTGLSQLATRVQWIEARTVPLFDNLAKIVIVGGAVYCLLLAWDLDVSPWLASAGIAGIALGFAAKDTLANLFGGLSVIIDAPYKIGDFINLDSGERGRVVKIGLRSTRLLTRDDVEITLPNAEIAASKIVNESGGPHLKTRVPVTVSVAYGSDVDRVREILLAAAESVEFVTDDPEPRIRFAEMGDSALIFRVLCWVDEPILRGRCIDALNTKIYKALGEAGIEIPFPQRVVHMASAS